MNAKRISTTAAPAAIGPYSQGYIAGGFLFTSGQGGLNPSNGEIVGTTVEEQAEQAMQNLKAILNEAGTDFSSAVKTTCFLANMDDFKAFNSVYEKYFTEKPARSCVAVKQLPLGILCEIEVIAFVGSCGQNATL